MKKELPSGWQEKKLIDFSPLQRGFDLPNSKIINGEYPIVYSNGIKAYHNEYKCKGVGVVTGRSGTIGKVTYVEKDYWPHNTSLWVTDFKGNLPKFVFYLLSYIDLSKYDAGTSVPTLNRNDVHKITVLVPPLDEQKRIAEILSTFDDLIENLNKLIEKKELYKKGIMQRVLTGKVRFDGFTDEWEFTTLDKIIVEKSIRNKDNKINLVLSVTNKEGFVIQNEFFGKTIASKDLSNYKIVDKYDFAYNPARVNVGSISMLENFDSCIVSPMYVVFSLNKLKIDKYFFKYWIQSNNFNGHIRSLSAGSVRSILSFDAMSTMKIKLPSLEEQNKIAELLTLIDKDIDNLKQILQLRKLQKKGVMQKLLTGEVRV